MRSKAQTDAAIAEGNPRRAGAPENQILATGPACLAWRHLNIEDCPVMIETTVPSGELTYRGIVYPWHCDHMGHMNVMWYVGKFDEATWTLMARVGLSADYLRSAGRGMAAVEQQLSYRRELLAGDAVSIFSAFIEIKEKSVRFRHVMVCDSDGAIAAETTLTGVHIDTHLRKACSFDPAIKARFQLQEQ